MLALDVKGLSKTYANGLQALNNVSLEVEEGDFFALLGSNGAGKSTLISIVTSLLKKEAGIIKIFSYDLDKETTQAKLRLGIVPQELNFNLFESVWNILINQGGFFGMTKAQTHQRAEMLLKKLDLWEKRKEASMRLSGGMKRRLMIARAMIHQPKLLILDEPTAGVDIELRKSMWSFLSQLNKDGLTIILTTHYLEEAEQLCKNIAIINHGQVLQQTNIQKFLEKLDSQTVIFETFSTEKLQNQKLPEEIEVLDKFKIQIRLHKDFTFYDIMNTLKKYHIQIKHIQNKSNRLEELFIQEIKEKNEHTK